jgi:hypothetical protein
MKKILIPIDYRYNNFIAIDYAIKFFKHEECEFYFINTYTFDVDGLNALSILQENDERFEKPRTDSEKNMGAVIHYYTLNNLNSKHRFYALSEHTNLVEGIKRAIKEIEINLVILPGRNDSNNTIEKYSKNTKRIIEQIRECPVMIVPSSAKFYKHPRFILASNFEEELPVAELQNWYELVKITKGVFKIGTLSSEKKMTPLQKANQNRVRFHLEMLSGNPVEVEYIETFNYLKDFANYHSDHIICLVDRKPDFWRKIGINSSKVSNLGPLRSSPLIALHH